MTSILFGGTALGWYRECTIIPYTTDVDFAAFTAEYNAELETTIKMNGRLWLWIVFGMVHIPCRCTHIVLCSRTIHWNTL